MAQPRQSFLGAWTQSGPGGDVQSFNDRDVAYSLHPTDEDYSPPLPGGRPRRSAKRRTFFVRFVVVLIVLTILAVLFREMIGNIILRAKGIPPGLWSKDGVLIIGEKTPFFIKGFSWFGLEERSRVLGGLDKVDADAMLQMAVKMKFNAIRLPLAYDHVMKNPFPENSLVDSLKNPGLAGIRYLTFVHSFIRKCAAYNILVLLDLHRLDSSNVTLPGLWYDKTVSEDDVVQMWKRLCFEFHENWNVMGADLFNEPYLGVWDNSKAKNNWKRAAERITNEIHSNCPHWLSLVEGMGDKAGPKPISDDYFFGENLRAMKGKPMNVKLPKKTALSPHVYGPSVANQSYFKRNDFASRMPAIWDSHFGRAHEDSKLAIIVGEWGGRFSIARDVVWQKAFSSYLRTKNFGFFYWCLNPDSADTGGLMKAGWRDPEKGKFDMLKAFNGTDVHTVARHFRRRF